MEENKIQHSKPVPPFVRFCAANIPMVFDDSLSYYEALCALWKWLQTDVIDVINNNARVTEVWREELTTFENNVTDEIEGFETVMRKDFADLVDLFNQLQAWVDNYFENLDVQEEINNKLDQMAEDGVLQEIITQYIQANVAWAFTSVANMKASTNLVSGSYAQTTGYYSNNDGGGAIYHITSSTPAGYYETLDNGLYAEIVILNNTVNAASYGIKGDGTYDDATAIQAAIDDACNYIQLKGSATDSFGGPIRVELPDKKMYIKTQLTCNQSLSIHGGGANTTLCLADDIDYMLKIEGVSGSSDTTNEETHLEGGEITNIRFDGQSRGFTCTSAIHLGFIDHFLLEDLWFMCVKGKCIELEGAREGVVNNIYTRFCGVYGSGCIEIITNHFGGDTSNLNMANNWNIVYPFGNAIKFVDGEFSYINNVVIHGMFDAVINQLTTYFGSNDYNDTDNDFIYLDNSKPSFTNVNAVYCPDKSVYIISNNSTVTLNNSRLESHKSTSESHGGDGNFVKLTVNSTARLNNVSCTCGYQAADIIVCDSTSKVEGYVTQQNDTYLNSDIDDFKRASRFTFDGEKGQPTVMGYKRSNNFKTFGRSSRANLIFKQTLPDDTLTVNEDALYIGTNNYRSRTVVAIPDEGYFVLPKVTQLSYSVDHTIFFDEHNNLKIMYYDDGTNAWVTKTINVS